MSAVQASGPRRLGGWVRTRVLGRGDEARDYGRASTGRDLACLGAGAAGAVASGLYAVAGSGGVPPDKLQHGGLSLAGTLFLGSLGLPPSLCAAFTFTAATVGKEFLWDGYLGRGTFDVKDIAANLSGSLAGYTALKALDLASRPSPPLRARLLATTGLTPPGR